MPQTHIEHPEDTILTGDLTAIEALYAKGSKISMKMDGMSLVWGTNPQNGKFLSAPKQHLTRKRFAFVIIMMTFTSILVIKWKCLTFCLTA